jgi:hypothetical protein
MTTVKSCFIDLSPIFKKKLPCLGPLLEMLLERVLLGGIKLPLFVTTNSLEKI